MDPKVGFLLYKSFRKKLTQNDRCGQLCLQYLIFLFETFIFDIRKEFIIL